MNRRRHNEVVDTACFCIYAIIDVVRHLHFGMRAMTMAQPNSHNAAPDEPPNAKLLNIPSPSLVSSTHQPISPQAKSTHRSLDPLGHHPLGNRARQDLLSLLPHHAIHDLADLLTAIHADGQHALQPGDLDSRLTDGDDDPVAGTERGDGHEGQLLLLGAIQVEQRIRPLVVGGVGRGRARGAGRDVVGHGDAGVDEGEGAGVEAGGEERAVLGEDVQRQRDGAVGIEVGEEGAGEGR